MIEKVKGISINGRCFSNKTNLSFFPHNDDRISIVYGKNGSGKSTISEGFSCISSTEVAEELSVSLIDYNDKEIALNSGSKIFVFNEKYIDENVKIDDDGLGTIILLGGQVDLQTEIDHYMVLSKLAQEECTIAENVIQNYEQKDNPLSPKYHLARVKKI